MEARALWRELRDHLSEMADALDELVRPVSPLASRALGRRPCVDVYETDSEVIVQAEVAGVSRENLEVSLKGSRLVIAGREDRSGTEGANCLRRERGPAEFRRELCLPPTVETEGAPQASLKDGLLTVRLPKKAAEQVRTVPVEEG